LTIRKREQHDLGALLAIAELVQATDGYPRRRSDGLRSFIEAEGALDAWVVEQTGKVAGQVVLRRPGAPETVRLASQATGRAQEGLGMVARLFVAPDARRSGAGKALINAATEGAHALGLWPVLDVARDNAGAVSLYDAVGWTRLGEVTIDFRGAPSLQALVYVGPAPLTPHEPRCRNRA
jgi:ribosomal protein S18 acetylase RimI-like enzyme